MLSNLTNVLYPKFLANSFMISLNYNSSIISNYIKLNILSLVASNANITASRSINTPMTSTFITIAVNILQPITTPVSMNLTPNSYLFYGGIKNIILLTNNSSVSFVNQVSNNYLSNCIATLPSIINSFNIQL
jgi:hypothetical protein